MKLNKEKVSTKERPSIFFLYFLSTTSQRLRRKSHASEILSVASNNELFFFSQSKMTRRSRRLSMYLNLSIIFKEEMFL